MNYEPRTKYSKRTQLQKDQNEHNCMYKKNIWNFWASRPSRKRTHFPDEVQKAGFNDIFINLYEKLTKSLTNLAKRTHFQKR